MTEKTRELLRTDKNGTQYFEVTEICYKCKGTGYIKHFDYHNSGICYRCNGTGHIHYKEKVYTPEYQAKLDKKAREKSVSKFLKSNGFNVLGKTYVVLGDTYAIEEDLKAKGCKFDYVLLWHSSQPVDGYDCLEVDINEYRQHVVSGKIKKANAEYNSRS